MDAYGDRVPTGVLDEVVSAHPRLRPAITTAAAVAEHVSARIYSVPGGASTRVGLRRAYFAARAGARLPRAAVISWRSRRAPKWAPLPDCSR